MGHSYTAFAIECVVDELADKVGADLVEYRLPLLPATSRLCDCLSRVAEMSRWAEHRQQGRALGIAIAHCFGSCIATVCEVVADAAQRPRVTHIWSAIDCGIAVHPDGIKAQVVGGAVFALTAASHGKLSVAEGRIVEGNFDRYPLLSIAETPIIAVAVMPSSEAPTCVGEVGVPTVAPAVINTWYRASGQRVRRLPLVDPAQLCFTAQDA